MAHRDDYHGGGYLDDYAVEPTMTDDELRAIAARVKAATPGPWRPRWGGEPGYITAGGSPIGEIYAAKTDAHRDPNLDFVCAARQDVPALLAALTAAAERERVLREAAEAAVAYVREWPIGVDTDPQEQRGGARDTMLANLRAALEATR